MKRFQYATLGLATLSLMACDAKGAAPTSEALAQVAKRLDTTDEQLAALETKLGAADERLARVATWVEERRTEFERREAARAERKAELERRRAERKATPPELKPDDSAVDWLTCKESEEAVMACVVSKKDFDVVLDNPASMAKWARVVPSQKDGRTVGFKFYGIRPGSVLRAAGVNNGDMLTAVNGKSMTSIDAALSVYTDLREAESLRLDFVRRGKAWTLELSIVE